MVLNIPYSIKTQLGIKETAEICLQCGVCCVVKGYSCPVQYDSQFSPTETYVYNCLNHKQPSSNPNIWQCVSCHKCELLCPYEVSPIRFIESMKEQALEKEQVPTMIIEEIKRVISTGYAFPVTSNTSRTREKLELGQVKLYDGLSVLAKKTGLLALLEAYKEE